MVRLTSILLIVSLIDRNGVLGFSAGAGGCAGDQAAVLGFHPSPTGAASYTILIKDNNADGPVADIPIAQSDDTETLVAGGNYTITVQANAADFKGVLIRIDSDDDPDALVPSSNNTVIADACVKAGGAVGVTHFDNTPKSFVSAVLIMPDKNIVLEVTVVQANNQNEGSIYSYSRVDLVVATEDTSTNPTAPAPPAPTTTSTNSTTPATTPTMTKTTSAPVTGTTTKTTAAPAAKAPATTPAAPPSYSAPTAPTPTTAGASSATPASTTFLAATIMVGTVLMMSML